MKLNLSQIKEITTGTAYISEENGTFSFSRFTKEQENLYKITSQAFYERTFAPAGVKLCFKTDSENLFLKLKTEKVLSRKFFSADVFVNDSLIGYLDNFSDTKLDKYYTEQEFPLGEFSKNFYLGKGEKNVCVHLPYSVKAEIAEISLDDNSFIKGIKHKKKLLAFGDSITQGYDALRPSERYISKLADKLDADEFNKGIGGESFFPKLSKLKESFLPDIITVAYGTNDWGILDETAFKTKCKEFFDNLTCSYPKIKIIAITPVWRKDSNEERKFGPFKALEEWITDLVKHYENVILVSGIQLIPHEEKYFGDFVIHPNNNGFEHYIKNLYEEIKNKI